MKQKLIVLVRDNGESPLSSSATLNILLVDGFSDGYMQSVDAAKEAEDEQRSTLTMYLVISLSLVSFIFLVSVIIFIIIKIYKRRNYRDKYLSPSCHFYGDGNFQNTLVDVTGNETFPQGYGYEVCFVSGSGTSEFKFLRSIIPSFPEQQFNGETNLDFPMNSTNKNETKSSSKTLGAAAHHKGEEKTEAPDNSITRRESVPPPSREADHNSA
ncbi:unnamed protein product [Natator depressus]